MQRNSGQSARNEKILLVTSILSILGTLGFFAFSTYAFFQKPAVTFEDNSYPVNAETRLVHISVRNEGQTSADEVVIDVTVDGEIGDIWTRKGRIVGEIQEVELFEQGSTIHRDRSSSTIEIPYIARGIKYEVGLLVKPKGERSTYSLLITSKNGGPAEKYVKKGPESLATGFVIGAIFGVAVVFLVLGIKRLRRQR